MRIAVIGDVMTDIDVHCEIVKHYGQSPVLRELNTVERPGGAANVARMCEALNVKTLLLGQKSPIIKRRFLVNGEMVFRHDSEKICNYHFSQEERAGLQEFNPQAIIIADHNKGTINGTLLDLLRDYPTVSVFIDPQSTTPCLEGESVTWVGSLQEIPEYARGRKIIKHGVNGVSYLTNSEFNHWDSTCKNCVDDLGAGDQFIVCLTIARLRGQSWYESVDSANKAAGEQCQRMGIQPLTSF